ncbi:MAG: hypothetical protein CMF52_06980 [Legionellales bacterium]|nr:hypothetical protein [Legionellales bacterium]|tara:strand:- start:33 stop:482 length:450 start_codon:yes stop_codon:yes gene_type:complete
MKITKKILENIIREEVKKLVQEKKPTQSILPAGVPNQPAPFVDDQAKVDQALYLMRKRRGDGGMSPEEKEKANPIKRSHRVSGDIGAPTKERAHIMQAIQSIQAALKTKLKAGLSDQYKSQLLSMIEDLKDIESATRYMTTGTSAGYTG